MKFYPLEVPFHGLWRPFGDFIDSKLLRGFGQTGQLLIVVEDNGKTEVSEYTREV